MPTPPDPAITTAQGSSSRHIPIPPPCPTTKRAFWLYTERGGGGWRVERRERGGGAEGRREGGGRVGEQGMEWGRKGRSGGGRVEGEGGSKGREGRRSMKRRDDPAPAREGPAHAHGPGARKGAMAIAGADVRGKGADERKEGEGCGRGGSLKFDFCTMSSSGGGDGVMWAGTVGGSWQLHRSLLITHNGSTAVRMARGRACR